MMARTEKATLPRLIRLLEHEPLSAPILPELARKMARLLRTDQAAVVLFSADRNRYAISALHECGFSGLKEILEHHVRGSKPYALYNPMLPEPSQRNTAIIVNTTENGELYFQGRAESSGRPNQVAVDLMHRYSTRQQARILVCDGDTLLAWVGGFFDRQLRNRNSASRDLSLLAPYLKRRLATERLLQEAGLWQGASATALNALERPAFLVSKRGAVEYANIAGRTLLAVDETAKKVIAAATGASVQGFAVSSLSIAGGPSHRLVTCEPATLLEARTARARTRWRLTSRQLHVLRLLVEGDSNKEIATRLSVSIRTVELHVGELIRKARVDSRLRLVSRFWLE